MATLAAAPQGTFFPLLFAAAGLQWKSRSWHEYETGKYLLADLTPDEYEKGLLALMDYLCL